MIKRDNFKDMDEITKQVVKEITRYFNMGLTSSEIAKLLDLTQRTVQRYIKKCDLREENRALPLEEKAFRMVQDGFSYSEIGKKLEVTKTTVYNWMRKRKVSAASSSGQQQPIE